jgi:type III secretion protein U
VVVTNPTHYAIALAYDPAEHAAPVLAAKGQDALAAEIRRVAEDAGVPIIRNPSLARELHDRVEIEETVPEDLFVVVAEVIVWASRLREGGQLNPP